VRAGLRLSVAAARGIRIAPMPAGRGLAPLADIPDGEPGHGPSELVIRRKHPVLAMPVLPRAVAFPVWTAVMSAAISRQGWREVMRNGPFRGVIASRLEAVFRSPGYHVGVRSTRYVGAPSAVFRDRQGAKCRWKMHLTGGTSNWS
jgi:hypothetical protein